VPDPAYRSRRPQSSRSHRLLLDETLKPSRWQESRFARNRGEARVLSRMLGTAALNDPETRVTMMKLLLALPSSLRNEAERLMASVHDDRVAWGRLVNGAAPSLSRLCDAVAQHRVVTASYESRAAEFSVKRLLPLGLVNKVGVWYLVADGECGVRTYRVPRLAGRSDRVDILSPSCLRSELARIGSELVAHYGSVR